MSIKKVATTFAASAMMLQIFLTPVSAMTIQVTGNGSDSDNTVQTTSQQETTVTQSNDSSVSNNISANSTTGANSADKNTGGDVEVSTGDSQSVVTVDNQGGVNQAQVDCCQTQNSADVLISGNGSESDNNVKLNTGSNTAVYQTNDSHVKNNVDNTASTGKNSADKNTGGSVSITTGDAGAGTSITNGGNVNSALVSGSGDQGGVSAVISGNGEGTDNKIALGLGHSVLLVQNNSAKIDNNVSTEAKTGKNSADKNTGGGADITTGDALAQVMVDNAVNFNVADVNCGCLLDVFAKVAGNGEGSENTIKANIGDAQNVFQDNSCGYGQIGDLPLIIDGHFGHHSHDCLTNNVDAFAGTGYNKVHENTGDPGSDPSVSTGDSDVLIDVSNSGNTNVFGQASNDWQWPEGQGTNVNITFNLHDLLVSLGFLV